MVINSQVFVFIFLPLTFILNAVILGVRQKWSTTVSNIILVLASFVFYAWGDISSLRFLIAESLIVYFLTLGIGKAKTQKTKKALMIAGVVFFIGVLCLYKYISFILGLFGIEGSAEAVTGFLSGSLMPLGISFFTFSAVSYVIDVYKGKTQVQKDFIKVILYLSFFGKITAGPIARYDEMGPELEHRTLDFKESAYGIRRFIIGLSKKMLIANTIGLVADAAYSLSPDAPTGSIARLGAFAYLLQIYFDFSGYSDMAIATAQIFGFKIKENFNYPYVATTVQDFWRRWHISVSTWFRDYLYIPLGGNRKGKFRTCLNKITVFFFTGLWHGANLTYVLWGMWHGLFLLIEAYTKPLFDKIFGKDKSKAGAKIQSVLGYIYTMLVVFIGFAMFRATDVSQGFTFIGKMFVSWGNPSSVLTGLAGSINPFVIVMTIVGIVAAFPVKNMVVKAFGKHENVMEILSFVYVLILFAVCILALATSTYNPFIYAQF